jgi:hypothetical protein
MSSKGLILSRGCSYGRNLPYLPIYHHYLPTYLHIISTYLPSIPLYLSIISIYLSNNHITSCPIISYMSYHVTAYHEWTTRTGELLLDAYDDDTDDDDADDDDDDDDDDDALEVLWIIIITCST